MSEVIVVLLFYMLSAIVLAIFFTTYKSYNKEEGDDDLDYSDMTIMWLFSPVLMCMFILFSPILIGLAIFGSIELYLEKKRNKSIELSNFDEEEWSKNMEEFLNSI